MKNVLIKRNEQAKFFYTNERCWVQELDNTSENPDLSIAKVVVKVGVMTQWHELSVNERYVILNGEGIMHLEGFPPEKIIAGDVVRIPSGLGQRIYNSGIVDLEFLCICQPRFTVESYSTRDDLESLA